MAEACGLEILAFTDHLQKGNGDLYNSTFCKDNVKTPVDMRKLTDDFNKETDVLLLAGAEAEILDCEGTVMISEETYRTLDFTLAHSAHTDNLFRNSPKNKTEFSENLIKCYTGAVNHPFVDALAHPFNLGRIKLDFDYTLGDIPDSLLHELAEEMHKSETYFDLMNEIWWWFPAEPFKQIEADYLHILKIFISHDVHFTISSDAHSHQGIGNTAWSKRMLSLANISHKNLFSRQDLVKLKQKHLGLAYV